MATIATSYGEFNVVKNNDSATDCGCNVFTIDGMKVAILPKNYWWDKDGITDSLEKNKENIIEAIEKKKKLFGREN